MAELICTSSFAKESWEKVKKQWEDVYKDSPTFEGVKFFYTYHTSPLFGIFRIRS